MLGVDEEEKEKKEREKEKRVKKFFSQAESPEND